MEENWDRFPVNIVESTGRIERTPFQFEYNRFEVWQGGKCIDSGIANGIVNTELNGYTLYVTIKNERLNKHIVPNFSFAEISTNNNRILWSKDILNTKGNIIRNHPDISSLFFKNGQLSKVTFTVHDPNTLVELY